MDTQIQKLIKKEEKRQSEGIEMIPSENYASHEVRQALGSVLTNKYSEGYPRKRYYGGNEIVDDVELLAQKRAKNLFKVEHVNVQPYSGSPANFGVYFALCKPGDTIMGLNLTDGGHLTHGWKVSVTGSFFKSIPYHVKKDGYFNMKEFASLARRHKPKLIWCGITAYSRKVHFREFATIADKIGAYLVADIAHIAGLVAGGVHPSPVPHVHIVTTTTHKTLRGPRGAMIMVTRKGLRKDPELSQKIDRAIFPGLQGGPHDNTTAAIAIALREASTANFKKYAKRIVRNAKALAKSLKKHKVKLVTDGTENHMLLIDLTHNPGSGIFAQEALEAIGITVNKNTVPGDPSSPFYPSGLRLGTPAATSRNMKEKEMELLGEWIARALAVADLYHLPKNTNERATYITKAKKSIYANKELKDIHSLVKKLCKRFPIPKNMV